MGLIPDTILMELLNIPVNDLTHLVLENKSIDQYREKEINVAYGYYQTMTETEKLQVKQEVGSITIENVLCYIAEHNPTLFDNIERLSASTRILDWLHIQIARVQQIPRAFDEQLMG